MGAPKIIKVRRNQDFVQCVLGLHIIRLMRHGYRKFEIYEEEENGERFIVIRALRRKQKKAVAQAQAEAKGVGHE